MTTRRALCLMGTFVATLLVATGAQALPSQQPDVTYMVDGPVRALVQVQPPGRNLVWIAGKFDEILKNRVTPVAAVTASPCWTTPRGAGRRGPHPDPGPVHRRSHGVRHGPVARRIDLYIAGQFNSVDGVARKNVAAIDPATGTLLPFAPKAQPASSVYASATNVYVGGLKLSSYQLDGTATPGFTPPEAFIDPTLRANPTKATFRDIEAAGTTLVIACQCDSIGDSTGVHATKALVQIDGVTGALLPWAPSNLNTDGGAFGIDVTLGTDPAHGLPHHLPCCGRIGLLRGVRPGVGRADLEDRHLRIAQAITIYQGAIVVGGHFDWSESPITPQCGKNAEPTPGCYHTPKLVALDRATGDVLLDPSSSGQPWNPGICCIYQGLWALLAEDANGTALHVGGEFKKAGGTWTFNGVTGLWELHGFAKQDYYARFSDPVPPPP